MQPLELAIVVRLLGRERDRSRSSQNDSSFGPTDRLRRVRLTTGNGLIHLGEAIAASRTRPSTGSTPPVAHSRR